MNDLIIVYLKETDGEIVIEKIDDEKHLDELTADMHPEDYALIGGVVYKDFEQKVNKEEFKKALNIMSKNKKYKR